MLSRLVITFLPRSKRLLISWLQFIFKEITEDAELLNRHSLIWEERETRKEGAKEREKKKEKKATKKKKKKKAEHWLIPGSHKNQNEKTKIRLI